MLPRIFSRLSITVFILSFIMFFNRNSFTNRSGTILLGVIHHFSFWFFLYVLSFEGTVYFSCIYIKLAE